MGALEGADAEHRNDAAAVVRWALAACAFLLLAPFVLAPASARALPGTCEVVTATGGAGAFGYTLCVDMAACTTDADCQAAGFAGARCELVNPNEPTTSEHYCAVACHNVYSCTTDADCPVRGFELGRCDTGPGDVGNICTYAESQSYCAQVFRFVQTAEFYNCQHDPTGGTSDYAYGDCDGDGCPNSVDPEECNPDVPSDPLSCPVAIEPGDCPTVLIDGGMPEDAGTADGGVNRDGGLGGMDASHGYDGSAPLNPALSFAGGGGCRCHVGAATRGDLALPLLLGLLAIVFCRRR